MTQTMAFDPVLILPPRTSSKQCLKNSGSSSGLGLSGMKKSLSFGLGRSSSNRGVSSSSSTPSLRKNVSFGSGKVCIVDTVEEDQKNAVWYSKKELSTLRKQEVRQNTQTEAEQQQRLSANKKKLKDHDASLESGNLTWRGLEDIKLGYNRVAKAQIYVNAVLNEVDMQSRMGYSDPYELRTIAKIYSKDDRTKAHKLALKDEKEALEKIARKKQLSLRLSLSRS